MKRGYVFYILSGKKDRERKREKERKKERKKESCAVRQYLCVLFKSLLIVVVVMLQSKLLQQSFLCLLYVSCLVLVIVLFVAAIYIIYH
jgi:cell division protein FtsW (lipid II flippase)